VRPPEEFGALLTRLLEARGISLRAWARTVGMGSSFAYKLKAGERVPPAPKIERMADALKLSPTTLGPGCSPRPADLMAHTAPSAERAG
jgi:transcriptional regulator with XRE-family HTH domain